MYVATQDLLQSLKSPIDDVRKDSAQVSNSITQCVRITYCMHCVGTWKVRGWQNRGHYAIERSSMQ